MDLAALIAVLSDPVAYPVPVDHIEVLQTHISVVFLAGPYVYKLKKPVEFGFVDFTTREKRRFYCEEEVRLNRRLAPDVYLGVVPLAQTADGPRLEASGEVIDWLVKMRRLPDDATLLARLQRGEVNDAVLQRFAQRLATFHASSPCSPAFQHHGDAAAVAKQVLAVLDRAEPHIATVLPLEVFQRLTLLVNTSLEQSRGLIHARAVALNTRDGHGDLHLDHVYLFPERSPPDDLVIIDCIEFNEALRILDPIADLAFAVMDLQYHGYWPQAECLADAYIAASGDATGRDLLPLYVAYRAMVRGMVELLKLQQANLSQEEQERLSARSRGHWLLALQTLEPPQHKPCLILMAGLPGSGKSTLARTLADQHGFRWIRTDAIRKSLDESATQNHRDLGRTKYTPESIERTYDQCLKLVEQQLTRAERVVVDATFRYQRHRQRFVELGVRVGIRTVLVWCQVPEETALQRIRGRKGDLSDADSQVYALLANSWEPVTPFPGCTLITLRTDPPMEAVTKTLMDQFQRLGLTSTTSDE